MRIDSHFHLSVPILIRCFGKGFTDTHACIAYDAVYMVCLTFNIVKEAIYFLT